MRPSLSPLWSSHLWGVFLAALAAVPARAGDELPADPIEALRNAIRLEQRIASVGSSTGRTAAARPEALRFHDRNLREAASHVKTVSDLSRALLLQDWLAPERNLSRFLSGDEYDEQIRRIEGKVRKDLADSFVRKAEQALKTKDPVTQSALAHVIAETVSTNSQSGGSVEDERFSAEQFTRLASELARALATAPPEVRPTMARALGRFPTVLGKTVSEQKDLAQRLLQQADEEQRKAEALDPDKKDKEPPADKEDSLLTEPERLRRSARKNRDLARSLGKEDGINVVRVLQDLLGSRTDAATRQGAAEGLLNLAAIAAGHDPNRRADPARLEPASTATTSMPTAQRDDLTRQVITAVGKGLRDDSVAVRRPSISALVSAAQALASEINITRQNFSRDRLPPAERPWAKSDYVEAERARAEIQQMNQRLQRILKAMDDQAEAIAAAIRDPDARVREDAGHLLDELGRVRRLLRDLNEQVPKKTPEKDGDVRAPVRPQLDRLSPVVYLQPADAPAFAPVERAFPEVQSSRDDEPGALPPPKETGKSEPDRKPLDPILDRSVAGLAKTLLTDPDVAARRTAANALESLGETAVPFIPQMIRALRDPDLFVRWVMARALGKMKARPDIVVPALARQVAEPDLSARVAAILALGNFGPDARAAVPTLRLVVNRGDVEVRKPVMQTLEKIGKPAAVAVPEFTIALRDDSPAIRIEAARILGRFGPLAKEALPELRLLSTDPNSDVRRAASLAILDIGGVGGGAK
jgi:HEAT repeat protein